MRAKRLLKLGALGLLFTAITVVVAWPHLFGRRVEVAHAERRELVQTVVTTGRVLPPAEVRLAALVSGNVTEVKAEVGARVARGALLVRLDDKEARANLARAKADLARARALRKQVSKVSAPVLGQSVAQAQARLNEAEKRHADDKKLFASGAIPRAELDRSATELTLARSEHASARARAAGAAPGGADSATAVATIGQADAELETAELRVARTLVSAPVDGIVLTRDVEPGDTVQVGSTLFVIAKSGAQEILIEPDERNLALLAVGQPATASAEAFPDRKFPARVSFIAPAVDPTRGTIEVRLEIPEAPAYLRPAMTLSVEVEVARKADALVAEASWVRDLATETPWVLVARDGRAERSDVKLGLLGDERVEIVTGADATTRIIPPTAVGVVPGSRVRAGGP